MPSFRVDLKREIDLIEEVARLYGVDKIPATAPRGAVGSNAYDAVHDQLAEARRILTGLGLFEAQGQTLISDTAGKLMAGEALVPLSNPAEQRHERAAPEPAARPAGRAAAQPQSQDLRRGAVRAWPRLRAQASATGAARDAAPAGGAPRRHRVDRPAQPAFLERDDREAKFDIYDLKGLLEEFLEQFGLRGLTYARRPDSTALFLESATVHLGKFQLGEFGQLLPPLARQYDLRDAVLLAELNLDLLLARRNTAQVLPAAAGFPRDPPRRGDDPARGDHARSRSPSGQTGQTGEPGNRRTLRRVPRQERSPRARKAWPTPSLTATRSGH